MFALLSGSFHIARYLLGILLVLSYIIINVPAVLSSGFCVTRNMFAIFLGLLCIKICLLFCQFYLISEKMYPLS